MAGCGDGDQAADAQRIDQPAGETTAEVAEVVKESLPTGAESASMAETADMERLAALQEGEKVAEVVVESATESVEAVKAEVAQEAATASAEVAAVTGQTAVPAEAQPDLAQGKQVYSKNCFACHGSGAAGAPKLGDTENWAPRIAQGMDTLTDHAVKGYKGKAGYMPPKGGFMSLSDAEVTAAVAYMVSESR